MAQTEKLSRTITENDDNGHRRAYRTVRILDRFLRKMIDKYKYTRITSSITMSLCVKYIQHLTDHIAQTFHDVGNVIIQYISPLTMSSHFDYYGEFQRERCLHLCPTSDICAVEMSGGHVSVFRKSYAELVLRFDLEDVYQTICAMLPKEYSLWDLLHVVTSLVLWEILSFIIYPISSEFPNSRPPECTKMPWTIWPALTVLWGVCWMLYEEFDLDWLNQLGIPTIDGSSLSFEVPTINDIHQGNSSIH